MTMSNDIGRYGSDGLGGYWVKRIGMFGPEGLEFVRVDDYGEVRGTGIRAAYDEAAMTKAEAVLDHLQGPIREADTVLKRRKAERPEPEPKPPSDPATDRFLDDGDYC